MSWAKDLVMNKAKWIGAELLDYGVSSKRLQKDKVTDILFRKEKNRTTLLILKGDSLEFEFNPEYWDMYSRDQRELWFKPLKNLEYRIQIKLEDDY